MKFLILLFPLYFFLSCKAGKNLKQETAKFEITKTVCFGACPEYTMTLDISGQAIFEGKKNVEKIGRYKKQVSKEEVRKLIDSFESANFWGFNERYVNPGVSDMPTTWIYFQHNKKEKRIEDYFNAPKKLKELERMLEDIANSGGWTKEE